MRIVFFGEDSFSAIVLQSLIDANHDVVLVVTPYYQNEIHLRLNKLALNHGIDHTREKNLRSEDFKNKIISLQSDLFVSAHFEKLLSNDLIRIPSKGAINLHPSLLPDYRGLAPQHWPIINGDVKTGVTVHFIDETADTGDIIIQKEIDIKKDDYVIDLQKKMLKIYKFIVVDAINLINKDVYRTQKQSHLSGRYYGRLKASQCSIDLSDSAEKALNLVRGVSMPYIGARIGDIIIWRAYLPSKSEESKIMDRYSDLGLYLNQNGVDFIVFKDSVLIIDKYENK